MSSLALVFGLVLATAAPPLRAGAATSNITPELGTLVVGGFAPYPAKHVHDELHARCLVLDDARTKLALVVCDLLGMHRSVSIEARRLIQEATGIPPQHVLISATHTHSAGTALGKNRYVNEQELDNYQRFVARRIADCVRCAVNAPRPAEIAYGTIDVPEHVFNRRWRMREGSVKPNPFGKTDRVQTNPPVASPDLVEPAGPTDPAVSILALREPGGRLICVYCAYGLHCIGGTGPAHISADYYGVFCEALKRLQPAADQPGGNADPPFVAMLANGTSPCETFAEIGPEFKRRSPLPHSFMVSLAHGYIGYLPTERHFELGGYETWPGTNSLEPQSSVKMLDALIEMAAEMAAGTKAMGTGQPKVQ